MKERFEQLKYKWEIWEKAVSIAYQEGIVDIQLPHPLYYHVLYSFLSCIKERKNKEFFLPIPTISRTSNNDYVIDNWETLMIDKNIGGEIIEALIKNLVKSKQERPVIRLPLTLKNYIDEQIHRFIVWNDFAYSGKLYYIDDKHYLLDIEIAYIIGNITGIRENGEIVLSFPEKILRMSEVHEFILFADFFGDRYSEFKGLLSQKERKITFSDLYLIYHLFPEKRKNVIDFASTVKKLPPSLFKLPYKEVSHVESLFLSSFTKGGGFLSSFIKDFFTILYNFTPKNKEDIELIKQIKREANINISDKIIEQILVTDKRDNLIELIEQENPYLANYLKMHPYIKHHSYYQPELSVIDILFIEQEKIEEIFSDEYTTSFEEEGERLFSIVTGDTNKIIELMHDTNLLIHLPFEYLEKLVIAVHFNEDIPIEEKKEFFSFLTISMFLYPTITSINLFDVEDFSFINTITSIYNPSLVNKIYQIIDDVDGPIPVNRIREVPESIEI